MKKYLNIFLAIAACSFVLASCQKEKEDFTPGDPDVSTCYGVFFPSQDASGAHTYDPEMEKTVEITVSRSNSSGAISDVPVTVTETADGEPVTGVFSVAPISFADGQTETTTTVSFPNITEGVNYGLSLTVTDPQYASQYKEGSVSFDFSVLCVQWQYFLNPKTGEKAVVHWTQDWWGESVDTYLKYYEVDGVRTLQTETLYDTHYYNDYYTGYGFFGACDNPGEGEWTLTWYTTEKNSKDGQYIKLNQQYAYHNSNYDADVIANDYFCHYAWVNPGSYAAYESNWIGYARNYGDPGSGQDLSYYDGNGGFFLSVFRYYMQGIGGWNPGFYDVVGIAEGFDRPDYSISLTAADPENYVTQVSVTTGPTVDYIVYDVFEGTLNSSQIESKFVEFGEDETLGKKVETDETGVLTLDVTAENTGVYTLVAVSFGEDVDSKEVVAKEYDAVSFNVEAEGQEVPVVVSCGLEEVPASQIALEGINPETTLQYYIYGSDLTDVKVALVSYLDIAAKGEDAAIEAAESADSLSADDLETINNGGLVDLATGLVPGTEFYLYVYATNGYEKTVIKSETSATTSGDPLMIYQNFDVNSYDADFELESAEDWYGDWNYYAVDYYGNLGMREYLGKVTISASETETEGPDDYGLYDEYVYLDGLFPNAVVDGPYYGYEVGDCVLEMDVYAGSMYSFSGTTVDGACTVATFAKAAGKWYSGVRYYSAFIPVADGYYAFVDVAGSSYDFTGLRVVQTYVWDAFYDMLLVDPSKDENGANPASLNAAVEKARKNFAEAAKEVQLTGNYKEDMHRIIDRYNQKTVKNAFAPAGLRLQRDVKVADVKVTVRHNAPVKREKAAILLGPVSFSKDSKIK